MPARWLWPGSLSLFPAPLLGTGVLRQLRSHTSREPWDRFPRVSPSSLCVPLGVRRGQQEWELHLPQNPAGAWPCLNSSGPLALRPLRRVPAAVTRPHRPPPEPSPRAGAAAGQKPSALTERSMAAPGPGLSDPAPEFLRSGPSRGLENTDPSLSLWVPSVACGKPSCAVAESPWPAPG